MVESNGHRSTTAPAAVGFFRVPGLFVRLSSKGGVSSAVDADSVWSPTSPLDFKSLRSSPPRVCLGLVDALTADDETGSMQFGARSSFLDSIKPFLDLALPKAAAVCGNKAAAAPASSAGVAAASLDEANEYADCEEYTCVISRGANPRTTHILAGQTVEAVRKQGDVGGCRKVIFSIESLSDQQPSTSSSPAATASVSVASGRCCCCMKRLQEDMDIFIYL